MITSKDIAEKIHMFYNLLYHLDDYIKNKKERKGQLRVSKDIRLILREIISSKINLNYFINKEELDSYNDLIKKENEDTIEKEKKYIKQINPLSFNQKNLETISLFYNSNNEIYVLNYLSLEKIFSIIRFCFIQIMKQKNKEFIEKIEKNNNNNFGLYQADNKENYNNKNAIDKKYNILKKILKADIQKEQIQDKNKINNDRNNNINILSFNRENINDIFINNKSSPNNTIINKRQNSLDYLRNQINKINTQMNLSLKKPKINRFYPKKTFKKNTSLPLIIDNKNSLNSFNYNDNNLIKKSIINNNNNRLTFNKIINNKNYFLFNTPRQNKGITNTFLSTKNIKIKDSPYYANEFDYKKIISLYNIRKIFSENNKK